MINTLKKNWPIIFIIFLAIILFGNTLIPPEGKIIYGGDLNDQFYFWKSFLVDNIKSGIVPFWNPYSFSGTPFLAHPSTAAFYPFTFIFFLFPLNIAFSIYLFIHVVLGGIFMYWFCKKYTDNFSSFCGSIIFSLSGLMAVRIYSGHIDIISTLIWIPAVFGAIATALETKHKQDFALAVLFLTLQILAGYQAVVIFTLELVFIYELVITLLMSSPHMRGSSGIRWIPDQVGNDNVGKRFLTLIFIIILSFGISAIQLLPTIEFVRNSIRGAGLPYETITWGSYTFDQFLMFINPFRYGSPFPENYTYNGPGPNFFEISYFVGIIPIGLFFFYLVYQLYKFFIKNRLDKIFLGLFISLIFFSSVSLGNNFPLHPILYKLVPFYKLFRFPSQHLIIVVFLIAFIASLAISKIKNNIIKATFVGLIIIELLIYDKKFIRLIPIPITNFDTQLIGTLKQEKELVRVLPDYSVVSSVRKAWDFESSMYYKIQSTSGYNPILLKDYYRFIDLLNKKEESSIIQYNVEIPPADPWSKDIDFLSVKYLLVDKNYDAVKDKPFNKYTLKTEGSTYRLYENKDYLPRFFINCPEKGIQKVEIVDYQLNTIKVTVNSACDGVLSSSEVYYPGWKTKIDGKEINIEKINTAFRSINLPKGKHLIEFYYQPTVYYVGGVISVMSLIAAILIINKFYSHSRESGNPLKKKDPRSSRG